MENQSNGKVFFVNGKQRLSQQGKSYFFSQNFDLSEIIKTIGTSNCCATIAVPKTARDENDRVLVLKPAIERNNDKGSYQKQNNQSNNQSNSQNYSKNANQNANQPNKPSGNYHGNYQNNYQDNYQGNNQNNYKRNDYQNQSRSNYQNRSNFEGQNTQNSQYSRSANQAPEI